MVSIRINSSEGKFLVKIKFSGNKILITSPLEIIYEKNEIKEEEKPLEQLLEDILKFTPSLETYSQLFSIFEEDLNIFKDEDDNQSLVMDDID